MKKKKKWRIPNLDSLRLLHWEIQTWKGISSTRIRNDYLVRNAFLKIGKLRIWMRDEGIDWWERIKREREIWICRISERIGGPGFNFFSSMVESVRRTLKRLSADADWPDRSARPGLLLEYVSTDWSPRVHPTYTQALSWARTCTFTRSNTLRTGRESNKCVMMDMCSRGHIRFYSCVSRM